VTAANGEAPEEPRPDRRPLRVAVRWLVTTLAVLALLLASGLFWLAFSNSGTRWLGDFAERQTNGRLVLEDLTGRLGRVACVEGLRWEDGALRVDVESLCLSLSLPALLFDDRLRITLLRARRVRVTLPEPAPDAVPRAPAALLPRFAVPLPVLLSDARLEELQIDGRRFEALRLRGSLVDRRLNVGELALRLDRLHLELSGALALTGDQRLALRGNLSHPQFRLSVAGAGVPDALTVAARLEEPRPAALRGSVDLSRSDLPWRLSAAMPPQAPRGSDPVRLSADLDASGDLLGFRFEGRAGLAGHESGSWFGSARGQGDWQSLAADLEVEHADGAIAGPVRLRWLPAPAAELELQAHSRRSDWPARLGLQARWGGERLDFEALQLSLGDGAVNGSGTLEGLGLTGLEEAARLEGSVRFDRLDLAALPAIEGLGGVLLGEVRVRGPLRLPRLEGALSWQEARVAGLAAEALELSLEADSNGSSRAELSAAGLTRQGQELGELRARALGGAAALPWQGELSLAWQQRSRGLDLTADLELQRAAVAGTLKGLEARDPRFGNWTLDAPVAFSAAVPAVPGAPANWLAGSSLSRGCLSSAEDALLCVALDGPAERVNWQLDDLALRLPLGSGGVLSGLVAASGRFEALTATPVGLADIAFSAGELQLAEPPLSYDVGDFDAALELTPDRLTLRAGHAGSNLVTLSARAEAAGRRPEAPLDGHFELGLTDLAIIEPLLPLPLASPRGDVSLRGEVAGSLAAPEILLAASWQNGALAVPALGLELGAIDARIQAQDRLEAEASLRSGNGTARLEAASALPLARLAEVRQSYGATLVLDGATLVNLPEYRGTASGHLDLQRQPEFLTVSGALEVGPARATINRVPETSQTPSADVVIVDAEAADRLERRIDVAVSFGEDVRVEGFGLATGVRGRLRVRESPGGLTRVTGNLDLRDGVFEGYGQNFVIARGRLIFDGPVDNPQLDIVAVKPVDAPDGSYQVRLHVTGPVDAVVTRISAEPAVSEADALSLLLTGRRLANASERERVSMSAAAAALGIKGASAVGERLSSSIGLDEMIIEGGEDSLVVGAGVALGDDVHLRYTYDVFSRLGGVLLSYALTDRLALEARSGDAHSIHLRYQIDR